MADELLNPTLPTPPKKEEGKLVVNTIEIRAVDLTPKDIRKYHNAELAASSVYYPNRTLLYDLYTDILRDLHLIGIMGKRIDAVLNNVLHFKKKGKKDDNFDTLIKSTKFREVMKELMQVKFWGISGMEFIPGKTFDFKLIPRKHIKPKWGVIAHDQTGQEGTSYMGVQNLWIVGKPDDVGLLLALSVPAIYKRGDFADWAQYAEIFGQPVRVIYYDPHDPQMKAQLQQVLDASGSSLALMLPRGSELELKDGKQSNGDGQLQERLKDSLNNEMSVAVLGNTETTTNGKTGTGAKSGIHQEQQIIFTKSDIADIENELNSEQFLAILDSYGYDVAGGRFEFIVEADANKVKARVETFKLVREMGTPVSDDQIYEETGIHKPDDYEQQKAAMAKKATAKPKPGEPETDPETGEPVENLSDKMKANTWRKLRLALADFFDPAHS